MISAPFSARVRLRPLGVAVPRRRRAEPVPSRSRSVETAEFGLGQFLLLAALQAVLGILCKENRDFAGVHGLATLGVGLYLAWTARDHLPVACWIAFVVGVETLWRMTKAPLFWEFSKYAIALVVLVRLLRRPPRRWAWMPLAYFALLLPAMLPTLLTTSLSFWRDQTSFYLSGPLCLMLCGVFLGGATLTESSLRRIAGWTILGVTSVAVVVLRGVSHLSAEDFGSQANIAASGGFGPNQVSSALGLGAIFALLLAVQPSLATRFRVLLVVQALWFLAHAALSFSRTGIYLVGLGLLAASTFLPLRRFLRPSTLLLVVGGLTLGLVTWGWLVSYTGGHITDRFRQTHVTGRDEIAAEDLRVWRENPVLGAGLGMLVLHRDHKVAVHTEYTRLLAEHGLLGVAALGLIGGMAVLPLRRRWSGFSKAILAAAVVCGLLSMAVSAMRTATSAFLIGLACAHPGRSRLEVLRVRPPGRAEIRDAATTVVLRDEQLQGSEVQGPPRS